MVIRIPVLERLRRTPQGVRGLKYSNLAIYVCFSCRTPQGVRGLKYWVGAGDARTLARSHPARGAWIEIDGCDY